MLSKRGVFFFFWRDLQGDNMLLRDRCVYLYTQSRLRPIPLRLAAVSALLSRRLAALITTVLCLFVVPLRFSTEAL